MSAPNLSKTFVDSLKLGYSQHGLKSLVPWLAVGLLVVPQFFVAETIALVMQCGSQPDLTPAFAAVLVMSGFLGSVSINVMREVFSLVAQREFSDYLKEEGVFDQYIFWPQATLLLQIALIFLSSILIFGYVIFGLHELVGRLVLLVLGLMAYVVLKTWDLADMVRKLAWHRQEYQSMLAKAREEMTTES